MENVFDTEFGVAAINRLRKFGKTNIRYEMIEQHGLERVQQDLNKKAGYACTVRICYDSHTPDDFVRYFYRNDTAYTVRIPIMPTVIIEKIKKNKK